MSKKPPPSFAPAYCALYPKLAIIAQQHGYAMAAHGSMKRDFDVVCIPWEATARDPQEVVDAIVSRFAVTPIGEPKTREHGRLVYTLSIGFGECFVDCSFTPRSPR